MGDVVYLSGGAPKATHAGEDILQSMRPVVVYFLHYGRNAWHATWIKRYRPNHFFRDIRSVKELVESRAWQGTVLYLDVLPAIQFDFVHSKFVLTEINTDTPFRDFNKNFPHQFGGILSKDEFLQKIQHPGLFWKREQSFDNRVILQQVNSDFLDFWSSQLVGNSLRGQCGTFAPLKVGYYRRVVDAGHWSWFRQERSAGADSPSVSPYRAAVKGLILSVERGPYRKVPQS